MGDNEPAVVTHFGGRREVIIRLLVVKVTPGSRLPPAATLVAPVVAGTEHG